MSGNLLDAIEIPGYELQSKIGKGAMASVYLAREAKLDRLVALKVMSKTLLSDSSFADRFLREARIVASISHHNIVTVFDVGSIGDFHYMAMELLPGGNLGEKLKAKPPLEDSIAYIKDIAKGLNYASSKKFIHRDIKPDNIMFGEDGRAVITDFGIARSTDLENSMTIAGSVIGTPQYMSPEQAGGEELDHRSDLYSLGIILYEMLAGKPPFRGSSAISTGVMHITQQPPRLPIKYQQFQTFVDKALAKKPEERFQSGSELIDALSQIPLQATKNSLDVNSGLENDQMSDIEYASSLSSNSFQSFHNHKFDEDETESSELELTEEVSSELSDEFLDINTSSAFNNKLKNDVKDQAGDISSESLEQEASVEKSGESVAVDTLSTRSKKLNLLGLKDEVIVNKEDIPDSTINKNNKTFSFPKKTLALITLVVILLGSHIFYVNVLNKDIKFFTAAISLSNTVFDITGEQVDFIGPAKVLDSTSKNFSNFVSKFFGINKNSQQNSSEITLEKK